ncbi:MAG: hypothetical protein U0M60_21800, partial [Clostridia bacterium]|nr:hypothetical protein [Clostridia bacterium]
IFVQAETATFENLDITSGEVSVNPRVGWMASALGVTNGDSGESSFLKNLTVENCNFEGSGAYQAMWLRLADVNVVNCTISGYAIGIETYPLGAEDEVNVVNTQITNVNNAIHSSDSVAGSKINVDNSIIDSNVIHIGGAVALSIENSTVKNADVTTYSASTFAVSNSKLYDTTYAVDENATGTITINENFANNVDTLIASADANDKIVYATYYPTEKDLDAKTNLTNVDKTSSIEVGFEATDDIREYDIVLKGTEGAINGFESAHFTFINNSDVDYIIAPNTDANITIVDDITNENRISFYMNADEKKPIEITSDYIKLGTVRFEGYGDVDFSIGSEDAKVNATTIVDSIVETFTPNSTTNKLYVNWTDADTTDKFLPYIKVEDLFVEQARDLNVVINFNNDITSQSADYTEMKVEVTGQNGEKHLGLVGDEPSVKYDAEMVCATVAIDGKTVTLPFTVTAGYRYTVKVSGAGYRTAEYTTVIPVLTPEEYATDEGITLTFWNNVKDEFNKTEIESGSDRWYTKNFLAGEIVQDNKINKYDLAAVVSYFGEDKLVENRPEYNKYDLNRDGVIDSEDIAYVLVSFGE